MRIKNNDTEKKLIISPELVVDVLIFTIIDNQLHILLVKINKNKWVLPEERMRKNKRLEQVAKKILAAKTDLESEYLEQLYSFDEKSESSRDGVVAIAYFSLIDSAKIQPKFLKNNSTGSWHSARRLPEMAFNQKQMVSFGINKLKSKINYSSIARALLPREFTLSEIQKVYEIVLGKKLDKRNFRKKIKAVNIIEPVRKIRAGLKSRPAELYRFEKRSLVFTK